MKLDRPTVSYIKHLIERVSLQKGGMDFWMGCNGYYTLNEIGGMLSLLEDIKQDFDPFYEISLVEKIAKDMDEYLFLNDIGKTTESDLFEDMGIEVSSPNGPLDLKMLGVDEPKIEDGPRKCKCGKALSLPYLACLIGKDLVCYQCFRDYIDKPKPAIEPKKIEVESVEPRTMPDLPPPPSNGGTPKAKPSGVKIGIRK